MTPRAHRLAALLAAAALLCAAGATGAEEEAQLPAKVQAIIMAKFLDFDQNLPARCRERLVIAIITEKGKEERRDAILAGFSILKGQKVQGKPITVAPLLYSTPTALTQSVRSMGANALYLAGDVQPATVAAVVALGNARRIPTFGGSRAFPARGVAVGFALHDRKPKLVINLRALKAQGMKVSAEVLQLAELTP